METYFLYVFDQNGRFLSREAISAPGEAEAVAEAERRWDGRRMELWQQGARVRAFDPTAASSGNPT